MLRQSHSSRLITRLIFGEQCRSWSSSLSSFLHSSVASSLLGANILIRCIYLCILFYVIYEDVRISKYGIEVLLKLYYLLPHYNHTTTVTLLTLYSLLVTWCATNSLTFNNSTLCPHCIYVFCIYLRTNNDVYHLQHKLIGFYNRDEKCLQRGTDWVY